MKHYTSISQSKKLLELGLSPESANVHWWITKEGKCVFFGYNPKVADEYKGTMMEYLPCWSLGALLNILPSATLDSSDDHYYRLQCMGRSTDWYDSAVDACVDMIEKLHKQNLL